MVGLALALAATVVIAGLAALPAAVAQPAASVPRVGVLNPGTEPGGRHLFEAFKQGMRELGYEEGRTVAYERRVADLKPERMSALAAELVRLKVDVIVTSTDIAIAAVRQQTQTIPIVMAVSIDPVGTGFVASLARPGGNVTGLSIMSPELSAKRVQLLREILPRLSRVAILWNPDNRGAVIDYRETETVARSLRWQVQSVELTRNEDLERAFSAVTAGGAEAVIVLTPNPTAYANRSRVASFVRTARLPSIYGNREFVDDGGLIAYGPSPGSHWRRAATYVHRILKGAKPGDLPVEQPTTFELSINVKTSKALGLTIPAALLQRADHLVQ